MSSKFAFVFLLLSVLVMAFPAPAAVPTKTEVIIVGAGLSGLATAYELKKAKIPFHILELTQRIGGRVRTVHYHFPGEPEIYADSGMEEYWESNPAVKFLKELKLPLTKDVAASSLVIDNKLEKLGDEDPAVFMKQIFNPEELKSLDAFNTKVAPMIHEILDLHKEGKPIPPDLMKLKDVAFSTWVKDQGVPHRVSEWIRISVECEIGTSWTKLSALDGLAEYHVFLGNGEMSYRVIGGNQKFTDALANAVGKENISVNKNVNRVVSKDGGVDAYYLDPATNKANVIHGKYLVSTIPLYWLFEVQFEPALAKKKREAIAKQSWGSYFKVHIFVKKEAEKYWTVKGESILPILSDSDLGVIYEGGINDKGPTKIISLLITGDYAEAFNYEDEDSLREELNSSFEKLWPGFTKEIKGMEFYRIHPRAIAGWPVGRSRYDELSDEVRRPENNVYLAGDFTEGTHSSGAFESALRVSADIIKKEKPVK